jgi:hypothetical protein
MDACCVPPEWGFAGAEERRGMCGVKVEIALAGMRWGLGSGEKACGISLLVFFFFLRKKKKNSKGQDPQRWAGIGSLHFIWFDWSPLLLLLID